MTNTDHTAFTTDGKARRASAQATILRSIDDIDKATRIPDYEQAQIAQRERSKEQAIAGAVERLHEAQAVFKLEIYAINGLKYESAPVQSDDITADPTVAQYA